MRLKALALAATACCWGPLLAPPAAAAEAAEAAPAGAPAADASPAGSDIIVTARKRQESILKVPVVETVLSAETLQQAQITDIRAVTAKVPGLIIGNSVLSVGAQISLRGVGTSALDAGIDQSVSLNIDGQQFSQGLTFKSGLFDLAQAEVLKGPQALFFGKNSPGGVIALTTADPGDHAEVIMRGSYEFEAREKRTEAIVSTPLTDTLGVRLAASWSDSDGYFYNDAVAIPNLGGLTPVNKRFGGNENYIIRGTVVWKPAPNLKIRGKLNFTKDHSDTPTEIQPTSCPNGSGPGFLGIQFIGLCAQSRHLSFVDLDPKFFGNATFQNGQNALRNGGVPFDNIIQTFGVLDVTYDVAPDVSASSTTTYYRNVTDAMINGTSGGAAGPALFADNHFKRRDVTEELRLQSDYKDRPLNWMIGGYYQYGRMFNRIFVGGNQALGLPATLSAGTHDVEIKSGSIFGQLRYKPVETLEIAAGVRWTDETRTDAATTRNAGSGQYLPVTLVSPKLSSKNWSPELTVTYTPTDTLTIFGALKQGYKSGSYSITTPATAGLDNSFGDEKVQGGEVGVKTRSPDRALSANLAFYYYKYRGLQVGTSQPSATGIPVLRTLNAGSARTYGVDFDLAYRPPSIENLSLNFSANWNKAKFLSLHNVPCYGGQTTALGCNESFNPTATSPLQPGVVGYYTAQDASGEPLERAPEWQLNGGFDYELPVGGGVKLAFGSSVQYSSKYKTVIGDRADYEQAAYAKVNGYVTLKNDDDSWELSVIGNNINDVLRAGYCANSNFKDTVVFGRFTQVTGGATNPTGKIDDVGCAIDPGRQVFLKLTLRPMGLFK